MSIWMDEAYSNVSKLLIHCKPYSPLTVTVLGRQKSVPVSGELLSVSLYPKKFIV